jgi:catechol 2,3-dioxygenase-like lactoylglutathione lyase family enzyme
MRAGHRIEKAFSIGVIALAATAAFSGPQALMAQEEGAGHAASEGVQRVVAVGMTVTDLDRSIEFYTSVLGFEKARETEAAGPELERLSGVFGSRCRIAWLTLGAETIELTQFLAPEGRPIPADSRSNDRWFQHIAIAASDMDKAFGLLRQRRVRFASTGPQVLPAWNKNAGGIAAFYFKDPDGHVLEVIHFPPGKGDPRWQSPGEKVFLGIDHTAIVVANTDRSLAFYRDGLGMRVAGESENYGTEQEHLNNVFGARLRITALRAAQGPGIELLEYLAPTDGRDFPRGTRANDVWHWHVELSEADRDGLERAARVTRGSWVSPGVVQELQGFCDFSSALQAQDPDGHPLVFGMLPGAANGNEKAAR